VAKKGTQEFLNGQKEGLVKRSFLGCFVSTKTILWRVKTLPYSQQLIICKAEYI